MLEGGAHTCAACSLESKIFGARNTHSREKLSVCLVPRLFVFPSCGLGMRLKLVLYVSVLIIATATE